MVWKYLYHFIHIPLYVVAKLLFNYRTIGVDHVPKKGSAILASNHASYIDPHFVGLGILRRINYLAKKELFSNALISYFLKNLCRALPVDREHIDRATLRSIYQLLRSDEILLMFPEGTRTYDGKLMEPKSGIGMIAYNTKVPVIPVYVRGSFNIYPRNAKLIRPNPCSVFYGPPVDLKDCYNRKKSKELYKEISVKIMEGIKELEQRAK